jgi:predicted aldo/keto reductase-like oxidoreductase
MSTKKGIMSRREFLKAAGAASLGSSIVPIGASAEESASATTMNPEKKVMPTRPFGKTGVDVSILSLGGVLGMSDQLMFRQAIKMGVSYWDTADSYGKPELSAGYLKKMEPTMRRRLLATDFSKAEHRCPQNMPITKLMQEASEKLV